MKTEEPAKWARNSSKLMMYFAWSPTRILGSERDLDVCAFLR